MNRLIIGVCLALLAATSTAWAAEPVRTGTLDRTAGFIGTTYYILDRSTRHCVATGARDEAWRSSTMGVWLATNQVFVVATRAYLRQVLLETEGLGGVETRRTLEASFAQSLDVHSREGVDALFQGKSPDQACQRLEGFIRSGALNMKSEPGSIEVEQMVAVTASLVDAADSSIEPWPVPLPGEGEHP